MQDEIGEVLRLIAQPIKSRNKLLSGESKFVLHSSLLFKLNKVLDIIENDSADIILSEGQRKTLELFLKVISLIPKLVVSQRSAESFDKVIDLRKFKRLRHLELVRICLENTIGIDKLKTQLETFICNRNTKYIEVIFKQKKLQWAELKILDLRHSQLSEVDKDFFKHMPWIQILDLSFNKLTSIDGLQSLDHLKCLNVSFNHLEKCPTLSKEAENKLEVLILNNNNISTLSDLAPLISLRTLDLSSNWVSNKSEFLYLTPLKGLSHLNMADNPVCFLNFYRVYLTSCLADSINAQKFVLDNRLLTYHEQSVIGKRFGSCSHWSNEGFESSSSTLNTSVKDDKTKEVRKGKRIVKNKRSSKPREVIIQDITAKGIVGDPKIVKNEEPNFKVLSESNFGTLEVVLSDVDHKSTSEKENALMKQLADIDINEKLESPQLESIKVEPPNGLDIDVETTKMLISATVHAHDDNCEEVNSERAPSESASINPFSGSPKLIEEESSLYEISSETNKDLVNPNKNLVVSTKDNLSGGSRIEEDSQPIASGNQNDSLNQSSESLTEDSDNGFSDTEDEVLWHVQRKDNVTGIFKNIILVLLDDELKERSTTNHHSIARWPLNTVQSCIKTKTDPVTVEIEFDTLKKDKRSRTYIMEFADAQVLLKKMYSILEARPLSDMNQRTYKCIKCTALFVRDTPSAFKKRGYLINCTICSSTLVVEVEEPRLPEPKEFFPAVSHSSSQSSIGKDNNRTEETASQDWKTQCSAASLEPGQYEKKFNSQKYESDIEVISNPSQSSIEVLDEHSRSVTPRRRFSVEEKQGLTPGASFNLSTVIEVNPPFANLTESSSSGSLTESVITAYEALNINRKKFPDEEVLTEEENSPSSELHPPDVIEEVVPTSTWKNETDIYSYTDFTDVDARVKLYLYQILFEDDNEGLLMIARCHLWKTGGSDYDGCMVISNLKIYFLSHSKTNFKEDTCDWLSKFDCYNLKDVKEIAPLLWQQGARFQIKHISYLALIMDKDRNNSFFKFLKGLSLEGIKIQNNCYNSSELALQQAVLSSCTINKCIDPTVTFFTICSSIRILKDDVEVETLRLGSLVLTAGEFHLIPGELSWLATTAVPSVMATQEMSSLIEVEKGTHLVNLHFLDEKEALEEVWSLKCSSNVQVLSIVDAIRSPWEQLFSVGLDVTNLA